MTTKCKIILGFVIMIALQAIMATVAYRDIQSASDSFIEYRRLARFNVNTSELKAALNMAVGETRAFVDSSDPASIAKGMEQSDAFSSLLTDTEQWVGGQEDLTALKDMGQQISQFKSLQQSIKDSILEMARQYAQVVAPSGQEIGGQFDELARSAMDMGNMLALYSVEEAWKSYGPTLASLSRFSESREEGDEAIAAKGLESTAAVLARLDSQLRTEQSRSIYTALMDNFAKLQAALATMSTNAGEVRKHLEAAGELEEKLITKLLAFNDAINENMRTQGAKNLESNADSQSSLLVLCAVALLIGMLLALFIIMGIMRVLKDLAGFADAVAAGDFTSQIKSHEKGEIGRMVTALREIPEVLQDMISMASKLGDAVHRGKLRDRLDTSLFPGTFGQLAVAVNTLGDSYVALIDAMPSPIMGCDKDFNIVFLNKNAQGVLGGEILDVQCSDQLHAPQCNTPACLGRRAMEDGTDISAETTLHPQGMTVPVLVHAIPLWDENGKAAGFMEIVTDLSENKRQHQFMLDVAAQASEIANRVAAASEQLSAQVEQVSRGAEMQRERMESTASAMTEMNATVLEVARSAGQASEQSESTRQKAQNGASLVEQVIHSITAVDAVGQTLQANMQELGTQAESIGNIMNVISDIADQTNLLALNAAIEAARAGEAGRGFAVVADEVRKLAEKTMQATQEVGSSITAVQHSARVNVEEVGRAVTAVREATDLSNSSGAALKEIVGLAESSSAVVSSIATAAEEQSATSEEINRAIDEINHVVAETAEGMVQSSVAVQDLSRMAQELNQVISRIDK